MELAIMLTLVSSFAILCSTHLVLALALSRKKPRWKGPLALLVPPLAPYWGYGARMRVLAVLWVAAFSIYVLALVMATIQSQA